MMKELSKSIASIMAMAALAAGATPARASSGEAWAAFRHAMIEACAAARPEGFSVTRMRIDPFGSASYGVAVLEGRSKPDGEVRTRVCIYDKRTRKAELSGFLDEKAATIPREQTGRR